MKSGWIKLYRSIIDDKIYLGGKNEPFDKFHAYMDLYLRASYVNTSVDCSKQGQLYSSIDTLAQRWRWSSSKVRRFLISLEKDDKILIETNNSGTTITLTNWNVEQQKTSSSGAVGKTNKKRKEAVNHDNDESNNIPF